MKVVSMCHESRKSAFLLIKNVRSSFYKSLSENGIGVLLIKCQILLIYKRKKPYESTDLLIKIEIVPVYQLPVKKIYG